MAKENYLDDYTVVGAELTETTTRATHTNVQGTASYDYKDLGVDAIDTTKALRILFEFYVDYLVQFDAEYGASLLNDLGGVSPLITASKTFINPISVTHDGGGVRSFYVQHVDAGTQNFGNFVTISEDALYYEEFDFDPAVGSFGEIALGTYSNSDRSVLVGISTETLTAAIPKFRYIKGLQNFAGGGGAKFTGYIQNTFLSGAGFPNGAIVFSPKMSFNFGLGF